MVHFEMFACMNASMHCVCCLKWDRTSIFYLITYGMINFTKSTVYYSLINSAFAEELLNQCIEGHTLNESHQRINTEKKDYLFTLDFEAIESSDSKFDKESHPLSLMVSLKSWQVKLWLLSAPHYSVHALFSPLAIVY